jgi:CheY-like chemotaxis protein
MPIMDGWQFLEEYVTLKPNLSKKITVFMISSSVDPTDLERAKKISEVSDYIVKPITPDALKEIILAIENQESIL